ncbi:MAG TPA: cytochrome P460 family protein [Terracidiphilus sp.]|nr:cytochrome P460 family protein [Terracidiphilus sp.]
MRKSGWMILALSVLAVSLPFLMRTAPAVKAADAPASQAAQQSSAATPAYAANGDMLPPANYREWVYLTSGFNMSYSAKPTDMPMFDNVFVNPAAYRGFLATGHWPDKTMLVLEIRGAESKGSINQHGHYQGVGLMGMEVHVKDEDHFKGKWAFFSFDSPTTNGTLIPTGAPCYSCHAAHGAVDTTFVQFYPTLLPVARAKQTLTAEFLKNEIIAPENR